MLSLIVTGLVAGSVIAIGFICVVVVRIIAGIFGVALGDRG